MLPERLFDAMSEQSIREADTSDWIAVLPLGATEQHGPHLPPETDSLIAAALADRLARRLPAEFPLTVLPVETVGYSPEHLDYSSTRSLPYEEAINRWIEKGRYLAGLGIRRLMLLNAHGGNSPLMTIVATELRVKYAMLCVATAWTRFDRSDLGLLNEAIDIHGGEIETSIMLALHPDEVDMAKAEDFDSRQRCFIQDNHYLRAYGQHAFGWKIQDLNRIGVTGNAAAANAEKGQRLIENATSGLALLAEDMRRFHIGLFDDQRDR